MSMEKEKSRSIALFVFLNFRYAHPKALRHKQLCFYLSKKDIMLSPYSIKAKYGQQQRHKEERKTKG